MLMERSGPNVRMLLLCAMTGFVAAPLDGQIVGHRDVFFVAGAHSLLDTAGVHKKPLPVIESTSRSVKLVLATGATLQGGDGWRIKHNVGVGAERQLVTGVSVIGFIDYARFDYVQTQGFNPPYRKDPSHILSVAAMLKACFPWPISPFVQVGVGISYVGRGNLYFHDAIPKPETDHVDGGGSLISYLTNMMVGVEVFPFKEFSLFLEGGINGDWQKDRYPANALGRIGIGVLF
jgi:hypothetical protein